MRRLLLLLFFFLFFQPVLSLARKKDPVIKSDMRIVTCLLLQVHNQYHFEDKDASGVVRIVKSDKYWGVVYPKEIALSYKNPRRFNPENIDIERAESILRENMKQFNKLMPQWRKGFVNTPKHTPHFSYRQLSCYFRQYEGWIKSDGDVLIRIYFAKEPLSDFHVDQGWNTWILEEFTKDYFEMKVNITKMKLEVNEK